jgi:hypothetical protein
VRGRCLVVALTLAPVLTGCLEFGKVDDAKAPGDMLGTFDVTAELDQSTCGEGALGSTDDWRFQVKLSRFQHDLYWLNGREAIVGSIGKDGRSFSFETRVDVDIPVEQGGDPACRIERSDAAAGKLSDDDATVESFEGTLSFTYRAEDVLDCEPWLLTPGAPARLPCTISYEMRAKVVPAD